MNELALFIVGFLVTLIVAAAVGLLFWGAGQEVERRPAARRLVTRSGARTTHRPVRVRALGRRTRL